METIAKMNYCFENTMMKFSTPLKARGLVFFSNDGKAFSVTAKCRNIDVFSIVKAATKLVLSAERERILMSSTAAAVESKKRVKNFVSPLLACAHVGVTDKNGILLNRSVISAAGKTSTGKLRDIFAISKNTPLFHLIVERGLPWNDARVAQALNAWCTAVIEQFEYLPNVETAIQKAAESNWAEAADALQKKRKAIETANNAKREKAA